MLDGKLPRHGHGAAIGMVARAARLTFLGALEVAGFGSVILEAGELADVGQLVGGVGGAGELTAESLAERTDLSP